ncbi:MAG: transaldolase [Bacteroidetes bacterium]|nr:transaldolase [Bacteroidota bacterium]
MNINDLNIKIFADGADIDGMLEMLEKPYINGFTTNPTLMKIAGITDYESFAREVLGKIKDKPISFEVFSDEFEIMDLEARKIASWGKNVNVKIPITNSKGESSIPLIKTLSDEGISLNITAIMTLKQVSNVANAINPRAETIVSVFAGRMANTGIDPIPIMKKAKDTLKDNKNAKLLWASPREFLNIFHAESSGCDIITVTNNLLNLISLLNKDLNEYSLETVQMFYNDAQTAGYKIL